MQNNPLLLNKFYTGIYDEATTSFCANVYNTNVRILYRCLSDVHLALDTL